ncbi:MAG: ATP-binding protein, partial [Deltaproteobacteria bacterium]|nr:ATP-binding protein [Deltaproteobacteria bacterium]
LREFADRPLPESRPRELSLPTDSGKVIGLSGVRRCGKTFLFFDTIRRLLARGVDRRRIIYLNFEDDRLQPVAPAELDLVLRSLHEVFPEAATGRLYLFLDEVQSAPGWERWVRRLCDTQDVSVFVTGSSSRLLTRDLSSAMRGRSVTYEVFPLCFREFLTFRGARHEPYDARSESATRAAFEDYLRWGGFPEVVLAEPAMRPLILEEYASVMLHRDLVERNSLRNEVLMHAFLRHCFRNTATLLSLSKLHRDFRSQGYEIARNTVFEYARLLTDAGLIFLLPRHDESLRKQARNPKKLHVIDPGLISAFKAGADRDVGHKFETAVFLECRRRAREWYYHAGTSELDLCDAEGRMFINACWNLSDPSTAQRQEAAMAAGARLLPEAEGLLLYHEHASDTDQRFPEAQPAWRWMLEPATKAA